jgi:hypothetical protein
VVIEEQVAEGLLVPTGEEEVVKVGKRKKTIKDFLDDIKYKMIDIFQEEEDKKFD